MRKGILTAFLALAMLSMSSSAWCYEKDVHFNLTYILCRLANFTQIESLIVADADQGLDDNDTTSAFPSAYVFSKTSKASHLWNPVQSYEWHSLADGGETMSNGKIARNGREAVSDRLDVLWRRALSPNDDSIASGTDGIILMKKGLRNSVLTERHFRQLVKFGQYMHYAQDYYSHRQPNDYTKLQVVDTDWEPYKQKYGHFADGHDPDRIPWRIDLAKDMAAFCYTKACEYSVSAFGRKPLDISRYEYDDNLKTAPLIEGTTTPPVAKDGMKLTDVLINAFSEAYPSVIFPNDKNKNTDSSMPPFPPFVPEECDQQLLFNAVSKVLTNTVLPSQGGSTGMDIPLSLRVETLSRDYFPLPLPKGFMIPPMKFTASGDVSMTEIFIDNAKWNSFPQL